MTKKELILELREVVGDSVSPGNRWRPARLVSLLSEGQDKFCAETGFFLDSTSYSLTTTVGDQTYPISSRIIQVKELFDGARRLLPFVEADRPITALTGVEPTRPVHWQADEASHTITFYEPPEANIVIRMRVWRYATAVLTLTTGEPEIPPEFHRAMVHYAASNLFGDHDSEIYDSKLSEKHRGFFNSYCADGVRAFLRIHNKVRKLEPSPLYSFT